MLTKTIEIDGRPVTFRASAAIPRMYRIKFGRDILVDLQKLQRAYLKNQAEGTEFDGVSLEIFENVAYIMAKHGDTGAPSDIETWLDEFNVFSIYEILPVILELWAINTESAIESKKKLHQVAGK